MGRRRTVRKNNGHTRGSSLMYVVLLMTLLAVLSSGYMAISRYNMKAALKNRRYMWRPSSPPRPFTAPSARQ